MSGLVPRPAPLRVLASVAAILLILLGALGPVRADTLSGHVYPPDARVGSVLFTWELERDLTKGALAAADEVRWDADVFRSYRYTRPPIGEVASVSVRYAVLDQLRSFEFHLALTKEHPAAVQGAGVVKMSPSSALLRLFVSPVYLIFSRDGRIFQAMIGRLLPMGVHGGKAHPIDGELVLHSGGG